MKRIGYDADTQVYTVQDHDGKLYKGKRGAESGVLTPVGYISIASTRASAFDSGEPRDSSPVSPSSIPSTFQDILPTASITYTKAPVDKVLLSPESSTSPPEGGPSVARSSFVQIVRKSAVPKVQRVVRDLRQSVTTCCLKNYSADRENLLPLKSNLSRSISKTTQRSERSAEGSKSSSSGFLRSQPK
ncbi:hypothetical protein E4T56_gene19268 [Termitomyces sp. T112]|nr:hypothetical protein E4T56_gene19268 [Termitomyces sp. T112]KAH0581035.1 hypothetical protein H2248_012177 [Termitomyces sp. 'cryptogamus']KNZ79108.1 hypothetical protein J132_01156 [Termitomyces sp. J132]